MVSNHKRGIAQTLLILAHSVPLMHFSPVEEGMASWPPHKRNFCWEAHFIQKLNNVRPFHRDQNPPSIHQCCKQKGLREYFSLADFLSLNRVSGSRTFIWAVALVHAVKVQVHKAAFNGQSFLLRVSSCCGSSVTCDTSPFLSAVDKHNQLP